MNFCRRLRERGHQVDALGPETYEPLSYLKGKAKTYRLTLGMLVATLRHLRAANYDIVEFYGADAWLIASILRKKKNRDFMMVSHSNGLETQYAEKLKNHFGNVSPIDGRRLKWYQVIGRSEVVKAFTQVDRLITVSEHNAEYARSKKYLSSANIVAVENSLPDSFIGLSVNFDRPPVIGYCGSWMVNKGSRIIAQDMRQLLTEYRKCSFRLIGVGTKFRVEDHFPSEVHSQIEIVPFTENKTELQKHYAGLSTLIVPSIYEGFGLVSAEAMACGCALVATRTGFAASLGDKQEAILMNEPSSPHLYNSVKSLMDNDDLRRSVAQKGYSRVQSLRWDRAVDQLEEAYMQWLAEYKNRVSVSWNNRQSDSR